MTTRKSVIGSVQWAIVCSVLISVAATGCLGSYGKARLDADLPGRFVSGQVPADYKYYYNGRENSPYAIVGIKPGYELVTKFWTPVTPNTDAFKKMARNAWTTHRYDQPVAGDLISSDGTEVGLWYSYYPWAAIKMKSGNTISVYSPYKPGSKFETID